jgi:hypothetical protein
MAIFSLGCVLRRLYPAKKSLISEKETHFLKDGAPRGASACAARATH